MKSTKNLNEKVLILNSEKESLEKEVLEKFRTMDKVNNELDEAKMALEKFR